MAALSVEVYSPGLYTIGFDGCQAAEKSGKATSIGIDPVSEMP
ncbi:hypothetical protein [Streptomyces atratus]|nr:hypothetical protein [Streptomyces atratus]MCX5345598.1 hypothetical protein [Streptomyces atratus]